MLYDCVVGVEGEVVGEVYWGKTVDKCWVFVMREGYFLVWCGISKLKEPWFDAVIHGETKDTSGEGKMQICQKHFEESELL